MAIQQLVLVDTCMWAPFFNRPQSAIKVAFDELLDADQVAIIGPIVSEVLLGFRRDAEADWVASFLRGVRYLSVTWDEWRTAAYLGRQLRQKSHKLPLSDLVLAAVSLRRGVPILTTDPHFDLVEGITRHNIA